MTFPQEFAQTWHRLLFDGEMEGAWRLMTQDFRRVVAQVALGTVREGGANVDAKVDELSNPEPALADFGEFLSAVRTILQNACGAAPEALGPGATTRVEAPAYEVVRLYALDDLSTDVHGRLYLPSGELARALTLIVASEGSGGWRMAGVGAVMAPGWPPTILWEPVPEV